MTFSGTGGHSSGGTISDAADCEEDAAGVDDAAAKGRAAPAPPVKARNDGEKVSEGVNDDMITTAKSKHER